MSSRTGKSNDALKQQQEARKQEFFKKVVNQQFEDELEEIQK